MATFIGYSTQQVGAVRKSQVNTGGSGGIGSITNPIITNKKFRTVDYDLVVRDLINSLNIPQGQKPGKPDYGTTIWNYVFEPNNLDTQLAIEQEIRRMAAQDPRLIVNSINAFPQNNGILLEIEYAVSPFNDVQQLSILFDQESYKAYQP
jgi:phage baseplate assembly protein W